jgi:hypothetical protein
MRFRQQRPALGLPLARLPSALLTLAVLTTLFAPALIQLAGRQTDPSFLDNRPPATMPALPSSLSLDSLRQFHSGFIRFIEDNFGLRAEMVQLNIGARRAIGVSAAPGLLIGKDGWFFLKTDAYVLDQFRGLNRFSDQDLDAWIDLMELQRQSMERQGAVFVILIAPNQQTIYPEHMPFYANRVWPETRLDQIMRRLHERGSTLIVIDPRHDLWAAREHAMLYHKYENHWNSLGAFVAYAATMREIKKRFPAVEPLQLSDYAIAQGHRVWNVPPIEEAVPVFSLKSPTRIVGRLDNKNPVRPIVEAITRAETGPTALLYGDSFGAVMNPFFDETFHRTIALPISRWPFPTELIEKRKPDIVILEMVERFLSGRPPMDETLETEYLLKQAPSLNDAIARSSGIGGAIEGAYEIEGRTGFAGWAVDRPANAPARLAFAYYEGRPIGVARMSDIRPDIAASMDDQRAGFRMSIASDAGIRQLSGLRFFSITTSGRIYELPITPTLRQHLEKIIPARAFHRVREP